MRRTVSGFWLAVMVLATAGAHAPSLSATTNANPYIDFGWPTATQRVYYADPLTCLTNVTNNCYAYLPPGQFTYIKSNSVPGGWEALVNLRYLTNFAIVGSPGTRLIFDNTCSNDTPNSIAVLFSFDGAANATIQALEIETKRRLASQTNFNVQMFAGSAVTNVLIQNVHGQQDWYVTNGPVAHADAFMVSVSANSCNLVMDGCQYGVIVPPSLYNVYNMSGQWQFSIDHGNYGSLIYNNCVLYGIEFWELDETGSGTEPDFINFAVRYPGALIAWYLNIYASDFTNASVWFNEQQNLTYYLSDTDPIFMDYDQYTNLDAVTVAVSAPTPPIGFTAVPTVGVAPLFVNFTDISVGGITNGANRFWDFGDGTTTNLTPIWASHTYASSGTFTVTEIDSLPGGSVTNTQTNGITVSWPSASFSAAPINGIVPLAVTFTDTSTGSISNWFWNFGDGTTANLTTGIVRHTFTNPGTYTVEEIITFAGGSVTNTQPNCIAALWPPPSARFTAAPTGGGAPLTVTFTDASTGNITNWFWNFGDGTTANATTPAMQHTYTTAGNFAVTEIVTGPGGSSTNTQQNYITVLGSSEAAQFQAWLTRYLGCTNCLLSKMTADADGTGQNNLFKYTAGLDPTNPASVFVVSPAPTQNLSGQFSFQFTPVVAGRVYTPQFCTDLVSGVWLPLEGYAGPVINGTQATITDLDATEPNKFYRIGISLAPFTISSITLSGQNVNLAWNAMSGTNVVQAVNGNYSSNFFDLATIVMPAEGVANYTDSGGATNGPSRFYRINLRQ